jgi:surface polysaccharide O-acyltransferase-like enzyme
MARTRSRSGGPTGATARAAGPIERANLGHTTTGHVPWLSWARIVAIVGVVAIHVCSHLTLEWGTVTARQWHFGTFLQAASRFSVPLFLMVSGAVLLRPRPGERLRDFYRRRASRVAIPLVVWTCGYLVFDAWTHGRPITPYLFVQGFLWGKPYYHLYFLYVVAGLYLVTPFLRTFVAAADRRMVLAATVCLLGLSSLDKIQHFYMGGGGFNAFSYFVPFLGYYLAGYVVATTRLPWPRRTVALGAAAVFVGTTVTVHVGTWWMFGALGVQHGRILYDYHAPTIVVASIAMAFFLRAVFGDHDLGTATVPARPGTAQPDTARPASSAAGRPWWVTPRVRRYADLTFGVFLLHPLPLELLVRRDQPEFASPYVDIAFHLGVIVALVVGCAVVTFVLRQVPVLRRLV